MFSPEILIKKLIRKSGLFIFNIYKKIKYQYFSSYKEFDYKFLEYDFTESTKKLTKILNFDEHQKENYELINKLSTNYLNHEFKLLGSDWVVIRLDSEVGENLSTVSKFEKNIKIPTSASSVQSFDKGKSPFVHLDKGETSEASRGINISNQKISAGIKKLLPKYYQMIDWQIDFRSGYCWNENKLSIDNKYGDILGVDVKHPWELGRMQHQIIFYHQWKISNDEKHPIEFRNQILDFISSNPPEFGIQWKIAMDAGIRAVNWLIVYSLYKSDGYNFDEKFDHYFKNSIFDHYYFVKNNLEWGSGIRGNHYFANISSLIIILIFTSNDDFVNDFNYFLNQLKNEIFYQFLDDGGNFEISLPYHYFVTEMLVVTLYYLINSNWQSESINHFINEIGAKLSSIFSFSISNLNNYKVQNYGDNDSGYFFRFLHPYFINNQLIEFNLNNYKELIELINYISNKLKLNYEIGIFEEYLSTTPSKRGTKKDSTANRGRQQKSSNDEFGLNLNIQKNNKFPDFGNYIFNNDIYKFNFYCSQFSKRTRGAHQHNDVLSFTLQIGDNDFLIDSGTFNYTAFPDLRNKFRSIGMHNTLQLENYEQREIPYDRSDLLFWLIDRGESKIEEFNNNYIKGSHNFFDCYYSREIKFEDNRVCFSEICKSGKTKFIRNILSPGITIIERDDSSITTIITNRKIKITFEDCVVEIKEVEVSPYYGELIKTNLILASSKNEIINWNIEILNEIN